MIAWFVFVIVAVHIFVGVEFVDSHAVKMNMISLQNVASRLTLGQISKKVHRFFTHCEKMLSRNSSNRKTCCMAAFHFAKTPTRPMGLHVKTEGGTRWNFVNFLSLFHTT